jgi:hypothetical protein
MSKEIYTGRPLEVLKNLTILEMKGEELLFLNSQSAPKPAKDSNPGELRKMASGIAEGVARGLNRSIETISEMKETIKLNGEERLHRQAREEANSKEVAELAEILSHAPAGSLSAAINMLKKQNAEPDH